MGTGVKVAMVLVLIVVVGAIFFFVNQNRKAGNTSNVVPMNAPAQSAVPNATKTEAGRGKLAGKPVTPIRTTPPEKPASGERRSIITPPPGRMPPPTTQPAGARPPGAVPGPTAAPAVRLAPFVKPSEPATQPRTPALPPLVTPDAASRPVPPDETSETPLIKTTPAVSPPPRPEPEPPAAATPFKPAPVAPAARPVRKYTVAEGETLWSIAEEQYGDPFLWTKLLAANPGISENVNVGQVLNLPAKEDLLAPAPKPAAKPAKPTPEAKGETKLPPVELPKPAGGAGSYTVAKGDTLYSIAAKQLGNGNRWRELLELNGDKLARPEDLQVGMELKLPPKEAAPTRHKTEPAKPEPKPIGLKKKT